MDDLPPPIPRITKLSAEISRFPAELIEPIIEKLSLYRVLQLSVSLNAVPGSTLLWSIENSPSWAWLFRNRFMELQALWISLNRLSWLWCRQPLVDDFLFNELHVLTGNNAGGHGGARLLRDINARFVEKFQYFLGATPFSPAISPAKCPRPFSIWQFEAVCIFLPPQASFEFENPKTSSQQAPKYSEVQRIAREWIDRQWNQEEEEIRKLLPYLAQAYNLVNKARSVELSSLANLYERFPEELKESTAPQTPRRNKKHILEALRRESYRILTKPVRKAASRGYYFRYPHPGLVPYDWCLRLFKFTIEKYPLPNDRYPSYLLSDLRRSIEGFYNIYEYDGTKGEQRCVKTAGLDVKHVRHSMKTARALPHPQAEMDWLESFLRCVDWMKTEFSSQVIICKRLDSEDRTNYMPRVLLDEKDYLKYIETEPASIIAGQLQLDKTLCGDENSAQLPSLLALYMPPFASIRAREVARYLMPDVHISIQQLIYDDTIKLIQRNIQQVPILPSQPDGHFLVSESPDTREAHVSPGDQRVDTTWNESVRKYIDAKKYAKGRANGRCYICRLYTPTPHKTFPSMCEPCGDFNLAGSSLSLPQNLDLKGQVALVTGGRVNLGYHTVLRLLRCGARVITSTRYPCDAVCRYEAEQDIYEWRNNVKIIGADFRTSKDAFELVSEVKSIVHRWGGKLDILVNNAAQTLTDSIEKEKHDVDREFLLQDQHGLDSNGMLVWHSYSARIRGGVTDGILGGTSTGTRTKISPEMTSGVSNLSVSESTGPSSWVQSLSDIPYEDLISAHSVNTFVPLILVRELLPIIKGHIVNISSREGIFELSTKSPAKGGKHVHTNMSKAGLNMITETEASTAWQKWGVAINTVDPGYMSAAPELESAFGGERPIGWEDGAGRVLWPIAVGEMAKRCEKNEKQKHKQKEGSIKPVWGRFLKHYGAVRVDVRLGRG